MCICHYDINFSVPENQTLLVIIPHKIINITMETTSTTMSFESQILETEQGKWDVNKLCFVCCSLLNENQVTDGKTNHLLSNNLNVFFLLKNLLQIPDNLLISYLKEFGYPYNWITSLCESCTKLTAKAMEFHWEMVKCQNELISIQMSIIDNIKLSTVYKKINRLNSVSINCSTWEKSRAFIKKHDYKLSKNNPFVEGDKLARILVDRNTNSLNLSNEHLNSPSSPKFDVENNLEGDLSDDVDHAELEVDQEDDLHSEQEVKSKKKIRDWSKYEKVNGKIKCSYCEKVFSRRKGVRIHENEFHSNNPEQFTCDICGKPWNTYTRLRQHRRDAHNLRPDGSSIKIDLSWELTNSDNNRLINKRKTKIKTSKTIAGETVQTKPLRDWSKYEKVEGSIKCNYCEKVFSRRKGVRIHEDEFHCSEPGQFVCDICGSPWNTYTRLRQHKRDVHKIRPDGSSISKVLGYTCHICGKGFPTPSKLNRHVAKHKEKM